MYQGQPGMSSTDFFNPDKFSWLRPGAVSQWLLQKLVGLTQAQGAWPIIYTAPVVRHRREWSSAHTAWLYHMF